MRYLSCRAAALAALHAVATFSTHGAQAPAAADTGLPPKTLFTRRDAFIAAGFAGLTVAMFPLDESVAHRLQNPGAQASDFLRNASRNVQYVADPGSVVIGLSLYAVGRVARWRNVEDLGLHGFEAVAISGVATAIIKDAVGRARPYASADTSPHDFAFARGLTDGNRFQSFPSGHTSAAFAAAAAFTSESRRWWPRATVVVAPVMYGGATLVGLSRMYNNAHWASDVVLGAAIGTFAGLKTVRYSHAHPDNPVDRLFLGSTPDGRLSVGWKAAF
jgi:membrane-associated phospholipid phosphatase